jgi:hypothetical protein
MSERNVIDGISRTMTNLIREDLASNEYKYSVEEINNFLNDYRNIIFSAAEKMYSIYQEANALDHLGRDGSQESKEEYSNYYLDFIPEIEDEDPLNLVTDLQELPGPLEEYSGEREGLSQEHNLDEINLALTKYTEESASWEEDDLDINLIKSRKEILLLAEKIVEQEKAFINYLEERRRVEGRLVKIYNRMRVLSGTEPEYTMPQVLRARRVQHENSRRPVRASTSSLTEEYSSPLMVRTSSPERKTTFPSSRTAALGGSSRRENSTRRENSSVERTTTARRGSSPSRTVTTARRENSSVERTTTARRGPSPSRTVTTARRGPSPSRTVTTARRGPSPSRIASERTTITPRRGSPSRTVIASERTTITPRRGSLERTTAPSGTSFGRTRTSSSRR